MSKNRIVASWLFAFAFLMTGPALAYIGPGAGITVLGALWGVLVAIVLALSAVLYLPIRAVLRKRRRRQQHAAPAVQQNPTHSTDGRTSKGFS
jgi:membrane protein implicated in regulation of membrane protease activity